MERGRFGLDFVQFAVSGISCLGSGITGVCVTRSSAPIAPACCYLKRPIVIPPLIRQLKRVLTLNFIMRIALIGIAAVFTAVSAYVIPVHIAQKSNVRTGGTEVRNSVFSIDFH